MLLITKDRVSGVSEYATMSMIISGLFRNLHKSDICFQHDRLWKNCEFTSDSDRSHDVYDEKGVRLRTIEGAPLFSTGCEQQNKENCAEVLRRSHDLYVGKGLNGPLSRPYESVCY